MSRNASLAVGFFATVAVLVPAGWHRLGANIQTDGKKVRPLQQTFTVDGARITLDVDRNLIMTGGRVKVKLVAYSDTPKKVAVDMTVQHSSNYEGERSEQIPDTIDIEKLVLDAAPNGGPAKESYVTLGKRPDRRAMTDSFKIYVAKKGYRPCSRDCYDGTSGDDGAGGGSGEDGAKPAVEVAAVNILGWSGNSMGLTIKPEGPITGDAPFIVAVTAKNTQKHQLGHPYISLGTEIATYGSVGTGEDDYDIEKIAADEPAADAGDGSGSGTGGENAVEDWERTIAAGKSQTERFRVTPKRKLTGEVHLIAEVATWDDQPGPVTAGAMEVRTFPLTVTDAAAPSVAAK